MLEGVVGVIGGDGTLESVFSEPFLDRERMSGIASAVTPNDSSFSLSKDICCRRKVVIS